MTRSTTQILTFPREPFERVDGFQAWKDALHIVEQAAARADWRDRSLAEDSGRLVQPIPSACLMTSEGQLWTLRRNRGGRSDLSHKYSIVFGGHVDRGIESSRPASFLSLMPILRSTLQREIHEELGVHVIVSDDPLGIVVDQRSESASRHICILFGLTVSHEPTRATSDEFAARAKRFFADTATLNKIAAQLDPWSWLVLKYGLGSPGLGRQQEFDIF